MENVLITGSARRLGSLIAEHLAVSGCFVWIHYRTHKEDAIRLRDRICSAGGHADCVYADLTDIGQIDAMLDRISCSDNCELTTLVNNASIFPQSRLENTTAAAWDLVMNTNLRAVWYLSKQFAAGFRSAKRIITIGDAGVSRGYREHAVYGLSKFTLKYLTEQMAVSFAPNIRANLLSPGLVLQGDREPDEIWQKRTQNLLTENKDVVQSILNGIDFLMKDPGMTGSELNIDNGMKLFRKTNN